MNEVRNEESPQYTATPSWEAIPGTGMDGDDVIEAAHRIITERWEDWRIKQPMILAPDDSREIIGRDMAVLLASENNERFGAIFLTKKHRVICNETLFNGTIDGAAVYPRVVAQRALALNAGAVVFYHNHPSGDPTPSSADEALTEKLKSALGMLDVRVLDHIVVSGGEMVSMAQKGLM